MNSPRRVLDDSRIVSLKITLKKSTISGFFNFDISVLDEIQYCKDAGRNLKYLVDTNKKLWITSSSEVILSKEILSFLVGRISIIKLYPFSYHEFLKAKGQKALTSSINQRIIWEHMIYGGYPKVVLTKDIEMKKTILRDLYETMLLKDVARTFSIEDIRSLEEFSKYLGSISINSVKPMHSVSWKRSSVFVELNSNSQVSDPSGW